VVKTYYDSTKNAQGWLVCLKFLALFNVCGFPFLRQINASSNELSGLRHGKQLPTLESCRSEPISFLFYFFLFTLTVLFFLLLLDHTVIIISSLDNRIHYLRRVE
jgi:hypothetical protein